MVHIISLLNNKKNHDKSQTRRFLNQQRSYNTRTHITTHISKKDPQSPSCVSRDNAPPPHFENPIIYDTCIRVGRASAPGSHSISQSGRGVGDEQRPTDTPAETFSPRLVQLNFRAIARDADCARGCLFSRAFAPLPPKIAFARAHCREFATILLFLRGPALSR